jgi:hypothetical protein
MTEANDSPSNNRIKRFFVKKRLPTPFGFPVADRLITFAEIVIAGADCGLGVSRPRSRATHVAIPLRRTACAGPLDRQSEADARMELGIIIGFADASRRTFTRSFGIPGGAIKGWPGNHNALTRSSAKKLVHRSIMYRRTSEGFVSAFMVARGIGAGVEFA